LPCFSIYFCTIRAGTRKTTGIVKLFARNGQTADLIPKDTRTATVQFLAFQPGRPVLVSVDSQNTITLFDLITRLPTFTHTARMTVTCIELLPSTDWFLVGYADASVDVYDIARGWRSPYVITDQHMRTTGISLPRGIPAVVGIVAHPLKLGKVIFILVRLFSMRVTVNEAKRVPPSQIDCRFIDF
jgi:WD40 repeat protein